MIRRRSSNRTSYTRLGLRALGILCRHFTVTPDVAMSDLLKTSRASEIFSITGLPGAVVKVIDERGNKLVRVLEVPA